MVEFKLVLMMQFHPFPSNVSGCDMTIQMQNTTFKTYDDWIAELKAYRAKRGHLDVSASENKSLVNRCKYIRGYRRYPEKKSVKFEMEGAYQLWMNRD